MWSLYSLGYAYGLQKNYNKAYEAHSQFLKTLTERYGLNSSEWKEKIEEALINTAYYALTVGHFLEAEQCAQKCITINGTQHIAFTNLAAALLFQGKYDEAEKLYSKYKGELLDSFLEDFKNFEEAGVIPEERKEDVERIKKILNE